METIWINIQESGLRQETNDVIKEVEDFTSSESSSEISRNQSVSAGKKSISSTFYPQKKMAKIQVSNFRRVEIQKDEKEVKLIDSLK